MNATELKPSDLIGGMCRFLRNTFLIETTRQAEFVLDDIQRNGNLREIDNENDVSNCASVLGIDRQDITGNILTWGMMGYKILCLPNSYKQK